MTLPSQSLPTSGTFALSEDSVVCGLLQNRASEVGIAAFDLCTSKLTLTQFVEVSRTFTTALAAVSTFNPAVVVILASTDNHLAYDINKATRLRWHQVSFGRAAFDDTKAALALESLAAKDSRLQLQTPSLRKRFYLSLGAAGAVLQYLEEDQGNTLLAGSLTVQFQGLEDRMQIDTTSIQALELLEPLAQGPGACKSNSSLLARLNHTKTKAGSRLLRANILQPLTHAGTLSLRSAAVEELVSRQDDLAYNAAQWLAQLPHDLDKVCHGLASSHARCGSRARIALRVQAMILLRELLGSLPAIIDGLEAADAELLKAIRTNCAHPVFAEMLHAVNQVLDEDVQSQKASFMNCTQQCFALKGGVDGFLDLARAAFSRTTEDIHDLVARYRADHDLETLKVQYAAKRGFHLIAAAPGSTVKGSDVPAGPLPAAFLQLEHRGRSHVSCTTHELKALNARLQDALSDCLTLTAQVLQAATMSLLQHMSRLRCLIDNIALLDMLCAFATVACMASEPYVRPKITQAGPIAIVNGRHVMLEHAEDAECQANDTYLAGCASFHIITGPNMAGKSTYLRQVALVVIMAQIGCFVPATFANIRIVDRLLTRIGTGDQIESNSSSFMVEMQEAAHIVSNATPHSLVLIDELGRATSTHDGIGLAWAISEQLIALGAYTLAATHFGRLNELANAYPNCQVWHFEVDTTDQTLAFSWKLQPGAMPSSHYGLLLAPMAGMPAEVVEMAHGISAALDEKDRQLARAEQTSSTGTSSLKELYDVAHKLECIALGDRSDSSRLLRHLKHELRGLSALSAGHQ